MMHKTLPTNKAGFTLIELLIVTTLMVMIMLTVSSLFMTFLLGNARTNVRKQLKSEGAYALNQMEFMLRNAIYIEDGYCEGNPANEIRFFSKDSFDTRFHLDSTAGNRIASNSSFLTSAAVSATELTFNCVQENDNKSVRINFTIAKTEGSTLEEKFGTLVNLRN
jgi:prepilin-type N-terminal cleavage/methylation domain-containing protein